jgi:hypothetical protein
MPGHAAIFVPLLKVAFTQRGTAHAVVALSAAAHRIMKSWSSAVVHPPHTLTVEGASTAARASTHVVLRGHAQRMVTHSKPASSVAPQTSQPPLAHATKANSSSVRISCYAG